MKKRLNSAKSNKSRLSADDDEDVQNLLLKYKVKFNIPIERKEGAAGNGKY